MTNRTFYIMLFLTITGACFWFSITLPYTIVTSTRKTSVEYNGGASTRKTSVEYNGYHTPRMTIVHRYLKDLRIGERGCYDIEYTSDGIPFAFAEEEPHDDTCEEEIYHDYDGWHGIFHRAPDEFNVTGYPGIPSGDIPLE